MTRSGPDAPVHIVVQNGEHWMRNIGDLAMLTVTLGRVRERWPDAVVHVMTSAPTLLQAYHRDVRPISDGRLPRVLAEPLAAAGSRLGPGVAGFASVASLRAREDLRAVVRRLRGRPERAPYAEPADAGEPDGTGPDISTRPAVAAALREASLVLAIGGGYMNDVDPWQFHRTLDLLSYGVRHGIPTAMVGQGLGPLTDPALRERAAAVLPGVDVIALREDRVGPDLLAGLGVPTGRIVVSGDDAIELAYGVRQDAPGTALGVCLRVAGYSPVGARAQEAVGRAVRAVAGGFAARLAPLVISEQGGEDRRSTLPLVAPYPDVAPVQGRFTTPEDVARRVGRCRVVVTGAYHLAVFALAQGIPVVGLSSSRYYDDKLLGLTAMFGGEGLELVRLDDSELEGRVASAARAAWERAPELRSGLRERASAQIELGRAAYERVFSLVDGAPIP
ncbi:polysaccharide pyruvyl transferase family protein [Pseudonocardia zijingensis]|uniref:Polysaccharide pyruvyl transferase domain-containing protein n=1 Tax=Pseudonocardia zijingensis TaxID=153376 RepID=A0ABN1NH49_9PSEU